MPEPEDANLTEDQLDTVAGGTLAERPLINDGISVASSIDAVIPAPSSTPSTWNVTAQKEV